MLKRDSVSKIRFAPPKVEKLRSANFAGVHCLSAVWNLSGKNDYFSGAFDLTDGLFRIEETEITIWCLMKRLFRFRSRTLLIVTGLVGCIGGWLAQHRIEHERESKLVATIVGLRDLPRTRIHAEDSGITKLFYDDKILG